MKNLVLSLSIFASFFAASSAHAAAYRVVEITAEKFPGEHYFLGVIDNMDHQISKIYYENNEGGKRYYDIASLVDKPVIVQSYVGIDFDIVTLTVNKTNQPGVYNASMRYLYHGSIWKKWVRKNVYFQVVYNPNTQQYEVRDQKSELITRAYATNHVIDGDVVGIDKILFSK